MPFILAVYSNLPGITLVFVSGIALTTLVFHVFFSEKTAEFGPTILTTTGIFATFLGIAIGLYDFDVANVQASVPSLLSGMKTAFWASVAGVGGALTLKYRHYAFGTGAKKADASPEDVTAAHVLDALKAIHWSLAGAEDGTMVSQLKLMRQDSNDRLDALRKAQTEALQMLSQMGSKALVEALRDVIKDFNAKINEQFGENFRHLNEGVAKLLVWQEQHKEHVETISARFEQTVQLAQSTTDTQRQVVEQSAAFSKTAADLGSLLGALEEQKGRVTEYSEKLGNLLNSAAGTIPQFEKHITAIAIQLSDAASQNQQVLARAVEETAAGLKRTLEASSQVSAKASEEHSKQVTQLIARAKEQIDVLDAALADELKKALDALGGQLAALSEKFVSDYGPLTDKLHRLVSVAGHA